MLDERLFLLINRLLSGEGATAFFSAVTHLGNGLVLAALVVPILYVFKRRDFNDHMLPLILAVAVSGGVVNLIKPLAGRERPGPHFEKTNVAVHVPVGTPSDKSFPSGHTQTAFGTAVYLSCMYPAATPILVGLASLVGLSRMAIGVHFPLDVLVGALFGTLFSVFTFFEVGRRKRKKAINSKKCEEDWK